jgi:hypothetical protein
MAEPHAVVSREIRRSLGRCDDVVNRHGQMNVFELHGFDRRAELLENFEACTHGGGVVGIESVIEEILGHADA